MRDEGSPLFGELDVVANRDITVGELGPYAGVLLRDDEVVLMRGLMVYSKNGESLLLG